MGFFRRLFAIVAKAPKAASNSPKDKPRRRLVKAAPVNKKTRTTLAPSSKKEDRREEGSVAASEGSATKQPAASDSVLDAN
ncbi:hypothetical protein CTA2_3665 [Colletotrichum tanaceti]|uniref:Uncharacterized protein n=1 Tax=Colletotrichum tanaceti TaxID=1306861 RepID=A0A4U6X8J9_9PEZI|nr:hypothetical protein CTA2_3665 [Colletotrichum tanaceti]TKW49867.1 hypothetical protein CTA1_2433 [Colletotrichum tanaceti]